MAGWSRAHLVELHSSKSATKKEHMRTSPSTSHKKWRVSVYRYRFYRFRGAEQVVKCSCEFVTFWCFWPRDIQSCVTRGQCDCLPGKHSCPYAWLTFCEERIGQRLGQTIKRKGWAKSKAAGLPILMAMTEQKPSKVVNSTSDLL